MPPKLKDEVKKGDKVQAKWAGGNIYYPATVKEVDGKHYKVLYDDGTTASIKWADLKVTSGKAEPKSNRVRSRSRSGGRKPQTRSKSRSPARKIKPPKLEKKTPKSEKKNNLAVLTPEKKIVIEKRIEDDIIKKDDLARFKLVPTNSATIDTVDYSDVVEEKIFISNETSSAHHRSSARIAALQTIRVASGTPESVLERKRITHAAKSKGKYSDDDDSDTEEDIDIVFEQKGVSYLSLSIVALKMILLPLVPVFFCFACTRKLCNLLEMPPIYASFKIFWNEIMLPLSACLTFHLILSILSKIPIGKELSGFPYGIKGKLRRYRLNGLYILLLSVATFGGLVYYKVDMNWGCDKIKAIVISSVIYTLLWSLVLHVRALIRGVEADQSKSNKKSGFLGNFYYGHEINPVLYFDEDVKSRFIQFGLIGLVLLDLSILTKFCLMKGPLKLLVDDIIAKGSPLLLALGMQLFTVFDYFWREETMLSTAIYTNDGVGYGFLASVGSLIPSVFALQGVYLLNYGKSIHLPHWCSSIMVVLFACGYYIYVSSTNLKHNFRRNPFSPSLGDVESIPTSKKKRLIVSGLWGVMRHPNYLGFMIMILAASLPCGFSHILPYTPLLVIIIMLVLRCFKIDTLCQEKYGPAWENYIEKVQKRLIPYIF